jgi:hypothetical protein
MANGRSANLKRLVLLLWTLVAFFYFYLSYDYIRVTMNDRAFADYLQRLVQVAGIERRSATDVRDLVLVKAEELAVPIRRDQVLIRSGLDTLDITVNYDVAIDVPVLQRVIYTKQFEHKVKYQSPR